MSEEQLAFTDKLVWECPTQLPPALIMNMRKYIRGLTYESAKVSNSKGGQDPAQKDVR